MEKSFDFSALLQNHEKKHKTRPTQFVSVAGGVRKRLESNIKCRKSSRLTTFDSIRNLPKCDSPKKQSDPLKKVEHRRMQLEKWKEEKERKKKQAAAKKKKPFVAGVAHAPLKFVPPPPVPKAVPSTSGRVTRSQSAKIAIIKPKSSKTTTNQLKVESFAPKNAGFKAPVMKNLCKVPALVPLSKIKKNKETITFHPVLPSAPKTNSKTKLKSDLKSVDIKINGLGNKTSQVDKLSPYGRYVKVSSSISCEIQHSTEDTLSLFSQAPKHRIRNLAKSVQSPSEEKILSVSELSMSNKKTSRKSIQNCVSDISPVSKQQHKSKSIKESIKTNITSTPKNPIPKSESSSEERLRSPKSPVDVPLTPEQIAEETKKNSPFVTVSRGKANARRETKKKIDEGLYDEDASDLDSVDHFRHQLNSEIKRMTEMCDTWEKISEQIVLPENVQEAVLGAVGQARLLMSHKLQQFAALVARCERPEPGQALVTPADLHGFWDMVFMQVVNVDVRFKKLEELRARNWVEEAPAVPRKKLPPKTKTLAKPAAASRLRDVIAAARKAKKQGVQSKGTQEETLDLPAEPDKTFEAGFFCVRSPVRSSATPVKPGRPSLLKAVLSSEAKKSATKNKASLAMLRASLIGKNIENDSPVVESTLTPINLHATPGRSILKPLHVPTGKKSIKVVLFDDSDVEAPDSSRKDADRFNNDNEVGKRKDIITVNNGTVKVQINIGNEKEHKENKPRKKSLIRQDATEETSPMMTRSRRKSMSTPSLDITEDIEEKNNKRTSRRKKALQEVDVNIIAEKHTPKRSSRRKSVQQGVVA